MADKVYDVIVVGAGNAALSAAIAAKENCESVTEDTAGLGAVGAYKSLSSYTNLGGQLTVFALPN